MDWQATNTSDGQATGGNNHTGSPIDGLLVQSDDVVLSGLGVRNFRSGVVVEGRNVTIADVIIGGNNDYGVIVTGANARISGSWIGEHSDSGTVANSDGGILISRGEQRRSATTSYRATRTWA